MYQIDADSWYNPLVPDSFTPLFSAAANGHDDIVKLLVEKFHADVNKGKMLFPGQCALSYAILNNHIRTVKTLVQLGAVNPKAGVAMKILQGWKDDHPVYVPRASLMLNVDHHVGDSNNRKEIIRYLNGCGIRIFINKTVVL